jgi:4-amino-4-deoxy-L-arabinose transferase-like glycosyltransferase
MQLKIFSRDLWIAHWPLFLALGLGLALRVALWDNLPRQGFISDEAEYLAAADWLANGRGFAWHTQYLWTRAPLYPLFIAGQLGLFGHALAPIFVTQSLLSLLNVALTYILARQIVAGRAGLGAAPGVAALLSAIYLPLASYAQLLLSETLFVSLLLGAFVLLGRQHVSRSGVWLGAGVLLGLATLTRGLTLGFMPLVVLWVFLVARRDDRAAGWGWLRPAIRQASLLIFAFGFTVAPWSFYASRAYGGTIIVDTTGAFNLALGTRTAFDGGRSDEPTRNFVLALLLPELSLERREALLAEQRNADGTLRRAAACLYAQQDAALLAALARAPALSQGERQDLLSAEARCLLRARPGAFVHKSLIELVDLFKINYTGAERLSSGFALGRLPPWYTLALFLLDDTLYVLSLPLALLGWALLRGVRGSGFGVRGSGDRAYAHQVKPPGRGFGGTDPEKFRIPAGFEGPQAPYVDAHGERAAQALVLLVGFWLLYNLAVAPLLFAINRFRVPLLPFAFVLVGVALAGLPQLGQTLRTRYGLACATLGGLLLLLAASPYAYFEPRAAGQPATWASYFGPYPSSLANTRIALATRAGYLAEQELGAALGAGDVPAARMALAAPELPGYAAAVGAPLLLALEGRPTEGLDLLASSSLRPLHAWQTSVVAGELFRQQGNLAAARRELGPTLVDNVNPVGWSWDWLYPPPLPGDRLELAEDNDLGYIHGFYLGRYDPDLGATTRWATGAAALRFPGAASGAPQQLCLALSGLGWPEDLALPTVSLALDDEPLGEIQLTRRLAEHCFALPVRPVGTPLLVRFESTSFVPDALDLIAQQGPQVGQLRLLSFQLAWAEVR